MEQESFSKAGSDTSVADGESIATPTAQSDVVTRPPLSRKVLIGSGFGLLLLLFLLLRSCSGSESIPSLPLVEGTMRNGKEVLDQASEALEAEAALAGADLSDSRCWITQTVDSAGDPISQYAPGVLCGPVLMRPGLSPWIAGFIVLDDYENGIARFGGFTTTVPLPSSGVRFYGAPEPNPDTIPNPPTPPDSVLDGDGPVAFLGVDETLSDAEEDLKSTLSTVTFKYSLQNDARCWLVLSDGPPVVCGPVYFDNSTDEGAAFVGYQIKTVKENFWSSTIAFEPGTMSSETIRLPDRVVRPDGLRPPSISISFPDPDPIESGSVVRLDESSIVLDDPKGANLIRLPLTESYVQLVGHTVVDRVGTGPDAVIAPPGETLAIVRFSTDAKRDTLETANVVLSLDGERSVQSKEIFGGGVYAISIPADSDTTAILEVTDEVAYPQSFDLRAGQRSEVGPSSLYRPVRQVDIGRAVSQTVDLAGENCVEFSGVVVSASVRGTDALTQRSMLPPDKSRLTVRVDYRSDMCYLRFSDYWVPLQSSVRVVIDGENEVTASAISKDGRSLFFHFETPSQFQTAQVFFRLAVEYDLRRANLKGFATTQQPEQEIFTADFRDPEPS